MITLCMACLLCSSFGFAYFSNVIHNWPDTVYRYLALPIFYYYTVKLYLLETTQVIVNTCNQILAGTLLFYHQNPSNILHEWNLSLKISLNDHNLCIGDTCFSPILVGFMLNLQPIVAIFYSKLSCKHCLKSWINTFK